MAVFAVIDTNVLISALLSKHEDAATVRIVEHMIHGNIIALYNDEILQEYEEVLCRPKFRFSEALVANLVDMIRVLGMSVEQLRTREPFIDPKDIVFYEVTMAKRDDGAYLVTGNKRHFPVEPFIVTPAEMLKVMGVE